MTGVAETSATKAAEPNRRLAYFTWVFLRKVMAMSLRLRRGSRPNGLGMMMWSNAFTSRAARPVCSIATFCPSTNPELLVSAALLLAAAVAQRFALRYLP